MTKKIVVSLFAVLFVAAFVNFASAQNAEAKTIIDATTKRMNWANGMEDVPELNAAIKAGIPKMITGEFTAQQFADSLAAL